MSERTRSFFTYLIVIFILLMALAVISPDQFNIIADAFSQTGDLFLVLAFIAIVVFIFRRIEERS